MKIQGTHTYHAPHQMVWSALRDATLVKQSIPGCKHFHMHADGKYHLVVDVEAGPFQGTYNGTVTAVEDARQKTISLLLTGSGPEVVYEGEGLLSLLPGAAENTTVLAYEGDVEVSGQVASRSPRLVRTTANSLIRSFLEMLGQEVERVSSVASQNGHELENETPAIRHRRTLTMQDFIEEVRRDRWIAVLLLLGALFSVLSLLGLIFIVLLLMRWAGRSLAERALVGNTLRQQARSKN